MRKMTINVLVMGQKPKVSLRPASWFRLLKLEFQARIAYLVSRFKGFELGVVMNCHCYTTQDTSIECFVDSCNEQFPIQVRVRLNFSTISFL
ncbi:hypothetical protein TB2_028798 [Malus domestica]